MKSSPTGICQKWMIFFISRTKTLFGWVASDIWIYLKTVGGWDRPVQKRYAIGWKIKRIFMVFSISKSHKYFLKIMQLRGENHFLVTSQCLPVYLKILILLFQDISTRWITQKEKVLDHFFENNIKEKYCNFNKNWTFLMKNWFLEIHKICRIWRHTGGSTGRMIWNFWNWNFQVQI